MSYRRPSRKPFWHRLLAGPLALSILAIPASGEPDAVRPPLPRLDLEANTFTIELPRFPPTSNPVLLKQYFLQRLGELGERTGAWLVTVEQFQTRFLSEFSLEDRRRLLDDWLEDHARSEPVRGPAIQAARLWSGWSVAASMPVTSMPREVERLSRSAQQELESASASPWSFLIAGLISDLAASIAPPATSGSGLPGALELWGRASDLAEESDAHLHLVVGDLLARRLDRGDPGEFCRRVAVEYERAVRLSPRDRRVMAAVEARYRSLSEAAGKDGTRLPWWFQELVYRYQMVLVPDNALAMNNLSYVYSQHGVKLDQALALAQRACRLQPRKAAFQDSLGWAHYRLGQKAEAVAALERALSLDSGQPEIHLHLATVLHDMGRVEEAIREYRATLSLDPQQPRAQNNLAYLLAEQGRELEEGLRLVDLALEARPGTPDFLDTRGWILHRMGREEEAVTVLESALEKVPGNAELRSHLADVLQALGRTQEADAMRREAPSEPRPAGR